MWRFLWIVVVTCGQVVEKRERDYYTGSTPSSTEEWSMPVAQRTVIELIDDLDGKALTSDGAETVMFALDGQQYEIDLSAKNATALRKSLVTFVAAGRRVPGSTGRTRSRGGPARTDKEQTSAIRSWARAHGHDVSDRGRISAAIRDAYHASS